MHCDEHLKLLAHCCYCLCQSLCNTVYTLQMCCTAHKLQVKVAKLCHLAAGGKAHEPTCLAIATPVNLHGTCSIAVFLAKPAHLQATNKTGIESVAGLQWTT